METITNVESKKVSELVNGDLIDLEGDMYADPHSTEELLAESYAEVVDVAHDTVEGVKRVIVTVDMSWEEMVIAFPADHEVPLGKEL